MADSIGTAYINIAPNMSGIQGKIAGGLKGSGSAFAEQFGLEVSGKSAFIIGAITGAASAATQKAMSIISSSIGDAVKRVDTLNSAQKTFQFMGFAAADAAQATKDVTKSIQGLPTPLDSAVRGMTALAATYGDVKLGQRVFTALNDAILGFGGSAAMVDNAIQQISQLPMDGPLDAQTWNSLRNSGITPVLVAMGKDMHKSVSQLKDDFGSGKLKVSDFINELTKLDTQGGGGLVALNKIAQNATSGIGTGFDNMHTSVVRGMAAIIQAVGSQNISAAISSVGTGFETVLKAVAASIPKIIGYVQAFYKAINGQQIASNIAEAFTKALGLIAREIPPVIGFIKTFFGFIQKNQDTFLPIAVGITAIVASIKAWQTALVVWSAVTKGAAAVQAAFNAVMAINPFVAITLALIGVTAGLVFFFTQTQTGKKVFADFSAFLGTVWDGILKGIKSVGDFFGAVWGNIVSVVNATKDAFDSASRAVGNFINAGVNVLNAALAAMVGWFQSNAKWFENIGIIIGTILLPKMVALGIQAGIMAAQWVAGMAQMAASTAVTAGKSIVGFIAMAVQATISAAITAAAWVASAARTAAAFVIALPGMIAQFAVVSAAAVANAVKTAAAWVLGATQTALAWAGAIAAYLAGVAAAAAQTLIAGARMAAGWLLALGPIGLIIAVATGAVALIIANWDKLGPFFSGLWTGIQNVVMGVVDWIKANWPLLLAIITGPIGLAVLFVTSHFQQIKDGAASMIGGLVSLFGSIPSRISGAIGNLGGVLYNSGRDLINGLLNGAGSLLSSIGQFFLNKLPGWIQTPFKQALGIHSPSKVFAGFGTNIVQGLVGGIDDGSSNITSVVKGMADSAIAGMNNSGLTSDVVANVSVPAALAQSTVAGGGAKAGSTFNIQNINLGDQSAVKEFFKQANQDTLNLSMNMTPVQGAQ